MDLPADVVAESAAHRGGEDDEDGAAETAPTAGNPPSANWVNNSKQVVDLVAAGSFHAAANLLRGRGIIRIKPFKKQFMHIYGR